MTKVKFKKKRLYTNLLLGCLWVALGTVDFIISGDLDILRYIYITCGLIYLFHFLYDFKHQYLIIENQTIQKNFLYGEWNRKFNLEDVISIEKSYLNYTIKTNSSQLKINADLIEDESFKELKSIMKSLNLSEDQKPALL